MNEISDYRSLRHPQAAEQISAWLLKLSRLVRSRQDDADAQQIALYTEMLIRDLPPAAFTPDALHYVAEASEWWPPVKTLRDMLSEHWTSERLRRENRRAAQIAGPGVREPLDHAAQSWVDFWHRREFTGWVDPSESGIDETTRTARKKQALSLIRSQSAAAYEAISGKPAVEPIDNSSWKDPIALRKSIKGVLHGNSDPACVRIVRAAVSRYAPENFHIVDEGIC